MKKKYIGEFRPSQKMLERYAHVLVNFALNNGKGIKKGDVVRIVCHEYAKPLYQELRKAVLKSGGHVMGQYLPDDTEQCNLSREFFEIADVDQLSFFPKKFFKAMAETIDHQVYIISETHPHGLDGVDPKKIMASGKSSKPYRDWLIKKENAGKFTWTLALYGTPQMAREAGLTHTEYWNEIIKACYLDAPKPVQKWQTLFARLKKFEQFMNAITKKADYFHMYGADCDITFKLGKDRKWVGGSGRNIPSFELFTSPDWRGTNGWIAFNQPLYYHGTRIEGIRLEFTQGIVTHATAKKNQHVLREMIAQRNADKVGEWSLTDNRLSRITKFMADTLYDENVGGPFGNTHIAVGNSYHDCYDGDPSKVSKAGWKKMGYNDSVVHTDVISTVDRTVVAHMQDGTQKVVYKRGRFTV